MTKTVSSRSISSSMAVLRASRTVIFDAYQVRIIYTDRTGWLTVCSLSEASPRAKFSVRRETVDDVACLLIKAGANRENARAAISSQAEGKNSSVNKHK